MSFSCYLCGGSEYAFRPGKVRDNNALRICECSSCGLVSLSSFEHITENFYEESLMRANLPCSEGVIDAVGHEDDSRRFRDFLPFFIGKRVLDVGCGNGQLLALISSVAGEAAGVELDKGWLERYERLGVSVYPGVPDKGLFDTLTMFHVLEHIPDPLPFLRNLKPLMDENSRLIIEVPSSQDALLTLYGSKAFSEFTYWSPHLFLYNPETLARLLSKAGFKTVEMRQFQRYPLANHLYWLANGKPGGQIHWSELRNPALESLYADMLAHIGKCDTIIGVFGVA